MYWLAAAIELPSGDQYDVLSYFKRLDILNHCLQTLLATRSASLISVNEACRPYLDLRKPVAMELEISVGVLRQG